MKAYIQSLSPEVGIAQSHALLPRVPGVMPLCRMVIELRRADPPPSEQRLDLVGAYDLSQNRAIQRGVGEAIERYALLPQCPRPNGHVEIVRGDPGLNHEGSHAGHGTRLPLIHFAGDQNPPHTVDSSHIDYQSSQSAAGQSGVESTPSGAASGLSFEAACVSAMMEIIERDAVMTAWARQLVLDALVPGTPSSEVWMTPQLTFTVECLEQMGRSAHFARCRTGIEGVEVYVALIISGNGEQCGFGAKASTSPAAGVLGSLYEAIQLFDVLDVAQSWTEVSIVEQPRNDEERARYWSFPHGAAVLSGWFKTFRPMNEALDGSERPGPGDLARRMVAAAGGSVAVVDLTRRLPEAAQEIGWNAVKAIANNFQPLRINETRQDTWNRERLSGTERRTGYASPVEPEAVFPIPHPLV